MALTDAQYNGILEFIRGIQLELIEIKKEIMVSKDAKMHGGPGSIPLKDQDGYPGKVYKADKDGFVQQTEKMDKILEIHLKVEYITLPFVRIKPYKPGRNCFDTSQWPNEPCGEVVIPVVVTDAMTKDDIMLTAINLRNTLMDEWIKLGNCAT